MSFYNFNFNASIMKNQPTISLAVCLHHLISELFNLKVSKIHEGMLEQVNLEKSIMIP